jgi:23S rRNA (guanine745-N1)-methyltransferase
MGRFFVSENGKRALSASLISQNDNLFRCPICSNSMKVIELKRFVCSSNHCFDLSKSGYVNLLTHPLKTKYDKVMFDSRRIIFDSGVFAPLDIAISNVIIETLKSDDCKKMLDAGCGEGSHLSKILSYLTQDPYIRLLGMGVDISKEGIVLASKQYSESLWSVGDIANLPFANNQFDFIINILSPSNYDEFRRVLTDDGLVVKVIPGSDYLQELRSLLHRNTDKSVYSNESTIGLFRRNFTLVNIEKIRYKFSLESPLIEPLINMTPLSWSATKESVNEVLGMGLKNITIDLAILVGTKE